jgi:flagellar biogenesis protein FliO
MTQGLLNRRNNAQGITGWLLEVFSAGSLRRENRSLELIETLPLGPKRQLMLVRCEQDKFLVGCGADGISSIVRVDGPRQESAL